MSEEHGPGVGRVIKYPGGKDGWTRVDCRAESCNYVATGENPEHAIKRVQQHARAKNEASSD